VPVQRGGAHVVCRRLANSVRLTLTDDGRGSPSMATLEERLDLPGSFVVATEIVSA